MYVLEKIPRYSLYALIIFTPLARASVQPWSVTIINIITLIALAAFLLEKTLTDNWKWNPTVLDLPLGILLFLVMLSTAFSVHRSTSLQALLLFVNYLIVFYLVVNTTRTRSQTRRMVYVIVFVSAFVCIFGLFKQSGINPFPWWDYKDLGANLLTSTYGNKNHLACYFAMTIPLTIGLLLTGITGLKRFVLFAVTLLLLTGLVLTLSRGGWMGALAGLVFMCAALFFGRLVDGRRLAFIIIAGVLVVALGLLASTPVVERIRTFESIGEGAVLRARARAWERTVEMAFDHPLLGAGPGTYPTLFAQYQPVGYQGRFFMAHNDYLHATAEIGFSFLVLLLWMTVVFYRKGLEKLKNRSRLVRGTTLGALSGVTAILVHGLVDFNFHIPANALLFMILVGLVAAPRPKGYAKRTR